MTMTSIIERFILSEQESKNKQKNTFICKDFNLVRPTLNFV